MAIYHLNANVISRARGQSIVAAAAYRTGARLRDERYGTVHNYVGKRVVAHSEIMAPPGTPPWAHDREALWNRVEAAELRKDSQLARIIEIGLPVELTHAESLLLVREYVAAMFVAQGMIADFAIRRDKPANPQVHILLTLRAVTAHGFGPKQRLWNAKANLLAWRSMWADRANEHLARAGHAVRIDHRTLEAQQIELTPARRMGLGRAPAADLPRHLIERIDAQRRIAGDNGAAILQDPTVALRALTHQSPTFTRTDLERFLRSRTDGDAQWAAAVRTVMESPDLVPAPGGADRFTSRDMLDAAKSLEHRVVAMAGRRGYAITSHNQAAGASRLPPDDGLKRTFDYLVGDGAAKAVLLADANRSVLNGTMQWAWHADGLHVLTVNPRMLVGDDGWQPAPAPLTQRIGDNGLTKASVLIVDDADLIPLKPLERVVAAADRSRAKVVLIAVAARVRAMGGASPLFSVLQKIGMEAT